MIKNFVLDTNVLLTDPHAIFKFADNNVVLPITVLEELDKFKRDVNDLGRNAREVSRLLDSFRDRGNVVKGVPLDNGGKLRVLTNLGKEPPQPFPTLGKTADSLILATALMLKKQEELEVVFVTGDINLRIRAEAIGLRSVKYEETDAPPIEEMYSGHVEHAVSPEVITQFFQDGQTPAEPLGLKPNQYVTLVDEANPKHTALGRCNAKTGRVLPLTTRHEEVWGISPRNREQSFALDLLLDDSVQVVTLAGKAGTGKTLLAIAAGIKKVADDGIYTKLIVSRPIQPLGRELGFLPGEIAEKFKPWMEPVFDNLEFIMNMKFKRHRSRPESEKPKHGTPRSESPYSAVIQEFIDMDILEVQPLTYIRGRSLPHQYLVVDEAQNLTLHEVKTIITRAGEGTKVVLTGDPYQIDNPFLDINTNGLSVVAERFKEKDIAGHITLVKGERSPLAELASNLL